MELRSSARAAEADGGDEAPSASEIGGCSGMLPAPQRHLHDWDTHEGVGTANAKVISAGGSGVRLAPDPVRFQDDASGDG